MQYNDYVYLNLRVLIFYVYLQYSDYVNYLCKLKIQH